MGAVVRPAAPRAQATTGRRMMSSDAELPTEGWEGAVRAKFPKDYQIVLLITGGYVGLWGLSKLFGGGAEEEAAPVAAAASSAAGAIPEFADESWDAWSQQGDNLDRWEKSLE
jgi:hypothetical protein